ncbi:MAG TPA: hypothetical protein VM143_05615 [Acidimicrobiales bacterium]|nr:hypothetical protein [Acidimicrobiales bacterium]
MPDDIDDATLSVVAHNLRGAIGLAVGATRAVRVRWAALDEARRDELLDLAERGMARVDDAVFGIARGLPADVIGLQKEFDRDEADRQWQAGRPRHRDLCVFDEQPGSLTHDQVAGLEDLAKVVTAPFEQRAGSMQLREAALRQFELIADLERERRRNDHLLERLHSAGPSLKG